MKRHRRTKQRTFRRPLREDELAKYLGALKNDTEKVVVRTVVQTGLRVSEFARLSPAVLDRKHQTITVLDGKGSKDRVVPVPHDALDRLERWFARREGTLGLSVPGIQYICYRLSQRAGLGARRVGPHILRHTYAVHALQKGATLAALQEVVGHDSMETTFIYLKMCGVEARNEFQRIQPWVLEEPPGRKAIEPARSPMARPQPERGGDSDEPARPPR